jgi:hypothetical protein
VEHPEELQFTCGLVELVEAASRSDKAPRAADALQRSPKRLSQAARIGLSVSRLVRERY